MTYGKCARCDCFITDHLDRIKLGRRVYHWDCLTLDEMKAYNEANLAPDE